MNDTRLGTSRNIVEVGTFKEFPTGQLPWLGEE